MRFEIFPDLYDIMLINEEKRIKSPTFLLLITKAIIFKYRTTFVRSRGISVICTQ